MKIYYTKDNLTPDIDVSLKPPVVLRDTGEDNRDYSRHYRRWQSAPCLVRTSKGRLLCTFSGDNSTEAWECPNNYNQISYSDNGRDWHQEAFVIDHPDSVRMHEPILWLDPQGRLWHFWSQSYEWWDGRGGVWAMHTEDPDAADIVWSDPVRLCDGVMATPPIAVSPDRWLYPVSVWKYYKNQRQHLPELEKSNVYVSVDGGRTLRFLGAADEPDTTFDENTLAQRRDGSLLMTMRCTDHIAYAESFDKGAHWTVPQKLMDHASARAYLAALPSGNLVLVTNDHPKYRRDMTAFLSTDGGKTWGHKLLLDARQETSYPAGCVTGDGTVCVAFDYNRRTDREILYACFTEEDILRGNTGFVRGCAAKAGSRLNDVKHPIY